MLDQLLASVRVQTSATANAFTDIELPSTRGAADDEDVVYAVVTQAVEDTTVQARLRVDHSPDGSTTAQHTGYAISLAALTAGEVLLGGQDRSVMLLDHLHPVLQIRSTTTGAKWVMVSVFQLRKRYAGLQNTGWIRRVGVYRLDSGAYAFSTGFAMPGTDDGRRARKVSYHINVLEASSSAQLALVIQHGPDGVHFATQRAHTAGSVSSGDFLVYDCDVDEPLGPNVRGILKMQAASGERVLAEVWEVFKTL